MLGRLVYADSVREIRFASGAVMVYADGVSAFVDDWMVDPPPAAPRVVPSMYPTLDAACEQLRREGPVGRRRA